MFIYAQVDWIRACKDEEAWISHKFAVGLFQTSDLLDLEKMQFF